MLTQQEVRDAGLSIYHRYVELYGEPQSEDEAMGLEVRMAEWVFTSLCFPLEDGAE